MSDTTTTTPRLLIVDDDPLITDTLAYALGKDFQVLVSDSRSHAVSLLRQLDAPPQKVDVTPSQCCRLAPAQPTDAEQQHEGPVASRFRGEPL